MLCATAGIRTLGKSGNDVPGSWAAISRATPGADSDALFSWDVKGNTLSARLTRRRNNRTFATV